MTATLSVAAFQASVTLSEDADVTRRLPGCDGAVVSPAAAGGVVWLLMVAVTVLVASRVPLSLSARTWKVCVPFAGGDRAVGEAVTEGDQCLGEHLVAVDEELDRAGVVLDLVAVRVVDGRAS